MPADINKYIAIEKNKLASAGAWLWLLDIDISGEPTIRFVNNITNISYGGNTYNKCNFQMAPYDKSDPGRLSSVNLSITNADLVSYILPYVNDYDGLIGAAITRTPVNSKFLNVDMSSKAEEFIVTGCSAGEDAIAFVLGAPSPLNRKFPEKRYFGQYCRDLRKFKGIECGYAGAETTCNGSPEDCEDRSNLARFGGQLGLRSNTVRFA